MVSDSIPEFSPELLKKQKSKPRVVFIVGPTACGKSALAIEIAKKLKGEIISADSMQVYQGMDIGTAKISIKDQQGIPHHGINLVPATQSYNAYDFRKYALEIIREIHARGNLPIITGGSGLYVRAVLEGLPEVSLQNEVMREKLEARLDSEGLLKLAEELEVIDPEHFSKMDSKNPVRVIRALEIYQVTGKKPSQVREKRTSLEDLGYFPVVIGIDRDREWLYERINERVDEMFDQGLVDEVKSLMKAGLSKTASQAVGYKEIIEVLGSEALSETRFTEAKDKIKQGSRNLAKRQWTWFKRERGINWVYWPQDAEPAVFAQYVVSHLKYANDPGVKEKE